MNAQELAGKAGSRSKIERYGWVLHDSPGVYLEIDKHDLSVDHSYQRAVKNQNKVLALAKQWSWVACGALIVADRDGTFYVVDGQHRWEAACKRSDILTLPCLVFQAASIKEESMGFLRANTQRRPLEGVERFKALVSVGDEAALIIKKLCDQVGRDVADGGNTTSVKCVSMLLNSAAKHPDVLTRLWPVLHTLSTQSSLPITARLVGGLCWVERNMPEGESLTDKRWRERLLHVGAEALETGASKAAAFFAGGGEKCWGTGFVEALNKKARIPLVLRGGSLTTGEPDEAAE